VDVVSVAPLPLVVAVDVVDVGTLADEAGVPLVVSCEKSRW
jgi:hypothetical protein